MVVTASSPAFGKAVVEIHRIIIFAVNCARPACGESINPTADLTVVHPVIFGRGCPIVRASSLWYLDKVVFYEDQPVMGVVFVGVLVLRLTVDLVLAGSSIIMVWWEL